MKVVLNVEDTTSMTGGSAEVLLGLLEDLMLPLGLLLAKLDPDGHSWVAFVEQVDDEVAL